MGIPSLHIRPGNPDFLDLPWEEEVSAWSTPRLVTMPTGVHRHPVVFVGYDEDVYAIKEMPVELSTREFEVLRALEDRTHHSARPAGLVEREWLDPREESSAAIITRYVRHAFPYRRLVSGSGFGLRRSQMLNALAGLLVELHVAGCYWGDCSLSNVLCRFDAGEIEAVMIDGETSELHASLSDGQRAQDIEIMKENLAGEMADIAAMGASELAEADVALGEDIERRYIQLWDELTGDLVIVRDEAYKIRQRLGRINDLGFSVHDIDIDPTDAGNVVRMRVQVGGRTFNSERLRDLTGIDASENQARVILGDLSYYLAREGATSSTGKTVATYKWLSQSYEPLTAQIQKDWHGDDPVQGYCDFLNHRYELAAGRGSDVSNEEAYKSWVTAGFPGFRLDAPS